MSTRRTVLALGAVAPFVGYGITRAQDATPVATPGAMGLCQWPTQEEAEAIIAAYWLPWNEHDVTLFGDLMAEDYVHHWGIGEDVVGGDAFVGSVDAFLAAIPDFTVTVDAIHVAGAIIVCRWTATGTQAQPFMGVGASDVTATWTGINIMRVNCGRILEGWGEADHFSRLQQNGMLPLQPAPEATPTA